MSNVTSNSKRLIYESTIVVLSHRSVFTDTDFPSPKQFRATIKAAFPGSGCEPEAFTIPQSLQDGVGFKRTADQGTGRGGFRW